MRAMRKFHHGLYRASGASAGTPCLDTATCDGGTCNGTCDVGQNAGSVCTDADDCGQIVFADGWEYYIDDPADGAELIYGETADYWAEQWNA